MSDRPTVIIPTFDAMARLAATLDALAKQTLDHRVVVVDNASRDGTAAMVADSFPDVAMLRLPSNLGFAVAANHGVAATDAATVVLLNNDVVCSPGFLEGLCRELRPSDDIVMAAGVLVQAENELRIDTAGIMFDRTLLAFDHLHGEPISAIDAAPDPLGPSGAAAAFDREAFDAVGGFDERFFAYLEDVDLVARLIARGGRCRLARGARAVHAQSATLGQGSRRKNELMGWSRGFTVAKYRLHRRPALFARAALAELTVASSQLAVDRTAAGFGARVRGFRAGVRSPAHELPPMPPQANRITLAHALRERSRRARGRAGPSRFG